MSPYEEGKGGVVSATGYDEASAFEVAVQKATEFCGSQGNGFELKKRNREFRGRKGSWGGFFGDRTPYDYWVLVEFLCLPQKSESGRMFAQHEFMPK